MQSNQTIKILVSALLILTALWALKTYWPQKDNDAEMYAQKWQKLKSDQISEITIIRKAETIDLKKDGNLWRMGEIQADGILIGDLLTNLLKPSSVMVVALTNIRNKDFSIASESAKLTIQQGSDKQEMTLGSVGNGGRYLTFNGSEAVYLVAGLPTTIDSTTANDWVDKMLTKVSEDKITKMEIVSKGSTLTLAHSKGTWTEAGKQVALDPSPLSAATSTLASLITQGLVDPAKIKDYPTSPETTVTVERSDGGPVTLKFYAGKSDALVVSSERAGTYTMATSVMDNFKIEPASLKPLPSPTPTAKS